MQIIHSEREYTGKASVLALGTFDGVHIGHAALIRRAHDIAADMGADCVVCTFDRHPLAVLHPGARPGAAEHAGGALCKVRPPRRGLRAGAALSRWRWPTRTRGNTSPPWSKTMRAVAVVVGENHRFGYHGQGDARLIGEMSATMDFAAVIVPPVYEQGELVSSTLIRRLLGRADARAQKLLDIGAARESKRPRFANTSGAGRFVR